MHGCFYGEVWSFMFVSVTAIFATFVVVQSLSRVRLFVTPWTVAHQVSMSFTISQAY